MTYVSNCPLHRNMSFNIFTQPQDTSQHLYHPIVISHIISCQVLIIPGSRTRFSVLAQTCLLLSAHKQTTHGSSPLLPHLDAMWHSCGLGTSSTNMYMSMTLLLDIGSIRVMTETSQVKDKNNKKQNLHKVPYICLHFDQIYAIIMISNSNLQ